MAHGAQDGVLHAWCLREAGSRSLSAPVFEDKPLRLLPVAQSDVPEDGSVGGGEESHVCLLIVVRAMCWSTKDGLRGWFAAVEVEAGSSTRKRVWWACLSRYYDKTLWTRTTSTT